MDSGKTFDTSMAEMDRIRRRAEIRSKLKWEFNKNEYNPYRQVFKVQFTNPAVERFMAARASRFDYWKPTWKSFCWFAGVHLVPIYVYAKYLEWEQLEKETKIRAGLVPAKDRNYKHNYVSGNLFMF